MTAIRHLSSLGSGTHRGTAPDCSARTISDRAAGEAYVASVCFKHGPPKLLGVELEFVVHHADDPARPLDADVLAAALGPHTPRTLRPDSPADPLPAGSPLTLEPGCQVEISALPQPSLPALAAVVDADLAHLTELLGAHGLRLSDTAIDAHRPPRRLLHTRRYAAMERRFAPLGPGGATMMCSTAGLQVCVDSGERAQLAGRWAAVHALGPVLLALFANSATHAGRPTGSESARWLAVMETERARTAAVPCSGDPGPAWAARLIDTPLMVVRRPDGPWDAPESLTFGDWIEGRGAAGTLAPPTLDDLDYHLTTMFTPVRPHGYLEIRYLDAQPPGNWLHPVALLTALLARPSTVERVLEVCAPVADQWETAARRGLADAGLAAAARAVADLGCAVLADTGLPERAAAPIAESVQARAHAVRE
ncbi:ergothioneine biosynthesis glutamate--cysteine ligase EgtA [Amycolatopsis antarctica]|uniref:Glutamate--cysteine ligase EgtA n=1 Tax=Amycolatopsis antarctica TaxID=1854586 RepID=A0A263D4U6_9PSEU|nr:glutamate-cysteine ligase family protein [Amycolatopsis antarctica]OZM72395.1 ergothioneine biosynthesis glutamate--cysteine ligase EgtA [Amycolatopsis antarctica]